MTNNIGMKKNPRFSETIQMIDQVNMEDPNLESWQGKSYPKEHLYAERMTDRLSIFAPDASEALQIAARAQHIGRWKIPRDSFSMDRVGYLKWRNSLKAKHADLAEKIMIKAGYDETAYQDVRSLIQKKNLKKNEETQILEDTICLVFIDFYLEAFAGKHTEEKIIDILRKTWRKMSSGGQQAAGDIDLSPEMQALLGKALQ
jgi:hypothetical protein